MSTTSPPFPLNEPMLFFGVDNCQFKVNGHIYEAIADEDDGYRSYLGSIEVIDADLSIFFEQPLDTVIAREAEDLDGWEFVSTTTGHVWLQVGTDNHEDYYPCFIFNYTPYLTPEVTPH